MRVLVTGSDGFVGRWLMRHLSALGDDAVALDPAVDVTDAAALRAAVVTVEPDAVIHLAAQASVAQSWEQPLAAFAVNATGTLHLTEAALACRRPPRVLLVGSAEVYGVVGPGDLPVGEDHPLAPVSPYAMTKATAELIGRQAWLGRRLEVLAARPFNHTGPGQAPGFVVPSLARQIVDAERSGATAIAVGDISVRRDLTDVRDVVRAYRMLVEVGTPGRAYNVCRGQSIEIAEVGRRLAALAQVELPFVVDPDRLRPVDIPDLRGDPSRLHHVTGWEPEIALDHTLADVLASLAAPTTP
ncbi:MAG: GDP-mannose 4,6-dehydratase [Actinomycetota bacterium]|nr:GDP-mannose 4,6-dehydratase [Actinomycetota bacterium]